MFPNSFEAALREPYLTRDDERTALQNWQQNGDREALGLLLRSHARQAWSQAFRWADNPTHREDLAAEGMMGLIRAANEFDLSKDVRFSSYAIWWVKNYVMAALGSVTTVIDIPARLAVSARKDGDGAARPMLAGAPLAIDDGFSDEDERGVTVASPDPSPEQEWERSSSRALVRRLLDEALGALDEKERRVILDRFAEDGDAGDTLRERMKIGRAQLQKIEQRAMHRMRRWLQQQGFSLALLEN